jgi:hypothetical protein
VDFWLRVTKDSEPIETKRSSSSSFLLLIATASLSTGPDASGASLKTIHTKNWVWAEIEVLEVYGEYLLTPIVANRCAQLVHHLGCPASP